MILRYAWKQQGGGISGWVSKDIPGISSSVAMGTGMAANTSKFVMSFDGGFGSTFLVETANGSSFTVTDTTSATYKPINLNYANSAFIGIGQLRDSGGYQRAILRSSTGSASTWTGTVLGFDVATAINNEIAYGAGLYVGVGGNVNGDTIGSSTDGNTWQYRWNGNPPLASLVFGSSRFVTVGGLGSNNNTNVARYSTNGVSWQTVGLPSNTAVRDLSFGGNVFLGVSPTGYLSNTASSIIRSTTSGVSWTRISLNKAYTVTGYVNGYFMVVGKNICSLSKDGDSWTDVPGPSITPAFMAVSGPRVAIISSTPGEQPFATTTVLAA